MLELHLLQELSDLSSRLWSAPDIEIGLREMLSATIKLLNADMGNVQLFDCNRNVLKVEVHQGFDSDFLDFFREVSMEANSACSRALKEATRITIEDIDDEPTFAPYRAIAKAAGFRAVQSTPLVTGKGDVLGVISTHFHHTRRLSDKEQYCLDIYARQAANFIERAQLDAALRRSELRFQRSFERNMTAMGVWAISGYILEANEALIRLIGFSAEEIAARQVRWDEITPEEWREADEQAIRELVDTGRCTPFEKAYRRKDGKIVPILIGGTLFDDEGGEGVFFAVDLTERKRIEEALKDADRRKDEFLAILAHELRNPIAPIHNGLQVLLRAERAAPRDHYAALLKMMERQVTQLVRLVDELLEVSRISRGKIRLNKMLVGIEEVLRSALETSAPQIEAKGHKIDLRLPTEPLTVTADPLRLAQAFTNLINNAVKYTPSGGSIEIVARREDDEAVVSFRDNGVGLSPEDLPHVFDLFTQIEDAGEVRGGLGIGLALVRRLVELHDGSVKAESEGIGKGSLFSVRLPLVTGQSLPVGTLDTLPDDARSPAIRALVIDDERDVADSFCMLLESLGLDARAAYGGLAGTEEAASFKPEIIFLDIGMPQMDGYETVRRIRASADGRALTIVALTGWGQDRDREETRNAGFDFHVTKPASVATLQEILDGITRRSA